MEKTKSKLNVAKTDLEKFVQDWINEKAEDYGNTKGVLEDLFQGGCVSGMVSELIYYKDTNEFYDNYTEEIWELLYEQSKEFGHKNILEMISSLNGANDVGSNEQFKNLLAWYAFEETARILANKAGIEI